LPDEVLLRVAGHLRGRARQHELAADAAPVALRWRQRRKRQRLRAER
jgi:hypothetical protein